MRKKFSSLIIGLAVFGSRLGFLPANVSPLGAFGFFSRNPIYFALSIVAFDYLVGGFYQGFWFNYLGFAMYWLIGRLTTRQLKLQLIGLPLASLLFFLISNFGVWFYWYPRTLEGLTTCYLLAVPFYRLTLFGDVMFGYGLMAVQQLANYWSNRGHFSRQSFDNQALRV